MTVPKWRRYLRFWENDPRADADDELSFHIDSRIAEFRSMGLTPAEAEAEFREAHALFKKLLDGSPQDTSLQANLLTNCGFIGASLDGRGKFAEALPWHDESVALLRAILTKTKTHAQARASR